MGVRRLALLMVLIGLPAVGLAAKPGAPAWQVFLQRDVDEAGLDRLTFISLLTGEEVPLEISGERYTPAGDAVLYYDPLTARLMQAFPDGTTRTHPFIQPRGDTRRIDWLVAPDGSAMAWTLVNGPDAASLTTITTVASLDGTNPRPVLVDGPRSSIRALPVAFSPDGSRLYMDFQPDGIADFTPFPQYAGLFAVDVNAGTWDYLPGEPGCFCGAGFGAGLLLRLAVAPDLSGFNLRVIVLEGGVEQTIAGLPLSGFTQAGDIVLSPDGTRAVYALAQVQNFGRADQSVRTVFMLVDLETMTQAPLTDPITTFVEPLAWTEDNSAILFTSRQRDGTWKISLGDGTLDKVANATYLGLIAG